MRRLNYFKKIKSFFKLIINIDETISSNKKRKTAAIFISSIIINQNKNKICVIVEAKPLTFYSIFYFQ